MRNVIRKIIREIQKGTFFDSHYIIATLIKKHSDDYLDFARQTAGTTRFVHGNIAKIIHTCNDLAQRAPDRKSCAISYTIHDKANKCALWKRK